MAMVPGLVWLYPCGQYQYELNINSIKAVLIPASYVDLNNEPLEPSAVAWA